MDHFRFCGDPFRGVPNECNEVSQGTYTADEPRAIQFIYSAKIHATDLSWFSLMMLHARLSSCVLSCAEYQGEGKKKNLIPN